MPRATRTPQPAYMIKAPVSFEPMSPVELTACLCALRWSGRDLAAELNIGATTVRKMLAGGRRVEPAIATWLRTLAGAHIEHEAPTIRLVEPAE